MTDIEVYLNAPLSQVRLLCIQVGDACFPHASRCAQCSMMCDYVSLCLCHPVITPLQDEIISPTALPPPQTVPRLLGNAAWDL